MISRLMPALFGGKRSPVLLVFVAVFALTLLPILLYQLKDATDAEASWYDGSWGYRKKITIDADSVSGSGNLSDFPILFDRTLSELASQAQPDGDDILFTSADGTTKLSHEIESFNSSTGQIIVWIKIPTLSGSTDTDIYMYYGNPSATSQQNPTDVWDANYVGVWHMKDNPAGTAPQLLDSTSNNLDMTSGGSMTSGDLVLAKAGNGIDFDGSNDYLTVADSATLSFQGTELTIEAWVKVPSSHPSEAIVAGKAHSSGSHTNPYFEYSLQMVNFGQPRLFYANSASTFDSLWGSSTSVDNWHYLVTTMNSTDQYVYQNGVQTATKSSTQTLQDFAGPFNIAANGGPGEYFKGIIDEVRLSKTPRSADWIATTYNTINNNNSFFSSLSETEARLDRDISLALNFDEPTGSTAYDSGPNQYNGTISGATRQYQSMCLEDGCYLFDGSDDVITVTNANAIDLDGQLASAFTASFWVRALSDGESNVGQIFQKGTNTYCRTDTEASGKVDLECSLDLATADATLNIAGALTVGQWHHVAMTYADDSDDEIEIFIDGKYAGTSTNGDGAPAADSNDLLIGGSTSANFHGFIDNFLIFDHAKDATGIAGISILGATNNQTSASLGGNPDWEIGNNLLAYWPLDSISSITPDLSGSGYTLDRYNTVTSVTGKFDTGSEHVPASSQYFGTSTTISGVKSVSFWTNPDSTTNYYVSLTSGAYITSTSGTLSATGFTNPRIYVNGQESSIIVADVWQHVVVTSDTAIDANQFYIGRQGTNYYDGTLDDVRLYSTQVDPRFVRMLYDWGPPPLMYWNFDENTGTTTVNDRVGPTLSDIALTNITQGNWVPGRYGSALRFDGSSSYGSVTTGLTDMNINQGTVSTWFKLTGDLSSEALVFNHFHVNGSDTRIRIVLTSAELISIRLGSGSNVSTGITAALNTWYHVALVWDSGTYRAYVNGVMTNTGAVAGMTQTQCVSVGAYNCPGGTNSYFNGVIDEMRVFDYAQTTEQVIRDMNGGHPLGGSPVGSQVVEYKMDEGYGTTLNNSISTNSTITGSISGASWLTSENSCRSNKCLNFDGTDDVVTVTNVNSIATSTGLASGYTISTWFYAESDGESDVGQIFQKGSTNYCRTTNESGGNVSIGCEIDTTGTDISLTLGTVPINQWHHLALVYSPAGGTTMSGYINGVLRDRDSSTGTYTGDGNLLIGGGTAANFDGRIDEFKIYATPLDDSEIAIDHNMNSAVNLGTGSSLYTDSLSGSSTAPVLHWSFDENTGTSTVQDYSGNSKTGTLNNFTGGEWVPGAKGSAVRLNGTNQSIARADDNDLDFGSTQASTISLWFKTNTISAEEVLVNKYDGVGGTGGYRIRLSATGNPECLFDNDSTGWPTYVITSALDFDDNKWHHLVCQRSSAGLVYLFVDGRLMGLDTITTASLANAANFSVGFNGGGNYFPGEIDDVKVYRSVVSTDHLAIDRNGGKPVFHWTMNECSGTTINDSMGILNATLTVGGSGSITSAGNCGTSGTSWYQSNTAPRGHAITLDGTDDKITTSAIPYVYGALVRTVGIWFYPTASVDRTLIGWGSLANNQLFDLMQYQGEIIGEFYGSGNNTITADSPSYTLNTWQHAAMVYSGGTASIYYNGKFANSKSVTLSTGNTTIEIGNSKNTSYDFYQGKLDDAKVWSYPLTAKQIEQEYLQGAGTRL